MTFPAQTGISTKTMFLKSTTVTLICRQKIPFFKKIRDESDKKHSFLISSPNSGNSYVIYMSKKKNMAVTEDSVMAHNAGVSANCCRTSQTSRTGQTPRITSTDTRDGDFANRMDTSRFFRTFSRWRRPGRADAWHNTSRSRTTVRNRCPAGSGGLPSRSLCGVSC